MAVIVALAKPSVFNIISMLVVALLRRCRGVVGHAMLGAGANPSIFDKGWAKMGSLLVAVLLRVGKGTVGCAGLDVVSALSSMFRSSGKCSKLYLGANANISDKGWARMGSILVSVLLRMGQETVGCAGLGVVAVMSSRFRSSKVSSAKQG